MRRKRLLTAKEGEGERQKESELQFVRKKEDPVMGCVCTHAAVSALSHKTQDHFLPQ